MFYDIRGDNFFTFSVINIFAGLGRPLEPCLQRKGNSGTSILFLRLHFLSIAVSVFFQNRTGN